MELSVDKPSAMNFTPWSDLNVTEAFSLWSDREATQFTNWAILTDLEQCQITLEKVFSFYSQNSHHFGPYCIRSSDRRFLGIIGGDARDTAAGNYEIWYFLHRDQWGKGLATRAVRHLLRQMRAAGRVRTTSATAVADNSASWALLERVGFTRTARVHDGFQKHGLKLDLLEYRLEMPVSQGNEEI
jgi:RimJ/RimL family protein N-acetyltransferase